jgi:hypothetical protein
MQIAWAEQGASRKEPAQAGFFISAANEGAQHEQEPRREEIRQKGTRQVDEGKARGEEGEEGREEAPAVKTAGQKKCTK